MTLEKTLVELTNFYKEHVDRIDRDIDEVERYLDKVVEQFKDIPLEYASIVTQPYVSKLYILRMSRIRFAEQYIENKRIIMDNFIKRIV